MALPTLSLFDASVIIQMRRKAPGDQRWQKASDRGFENGQKILTTSRNIDRQLCTQQLHLLDLLTVLPDQISQILTPYRINNKYNVTKINNCMQFSSQKITHIQFWFQSAFFFSSYFLSPNQQCQSTEKKINTPKMFTAKNNHTALTCT